MIVTIARQNGSGGREVGKLLAERLGVPCYDREIVEETAKRANVSVEEVERNEERVRTGSKLFFGGQPSANPIYVQQSDAIRDLASGGDSVFVGRCADYVLSQRDDVVSVFVAAPMSDRIRRSSQRNGISEREAYERITSKDREREDYCLRYTGRRWGDAGNYDLTVSTGRIGVGGAVEVILAYMQRL